MLTVSQLLAALQEDPDNTTRLAELRDALASGDAARVGDDAVHLVDLARQQHEARSEYVAVAGLLLARAGARGAAEADPDSRAAMLVAAAKLTSEELLDDAAARALYEEALALRPGDDAIKAAIAGIDEAGANWKDFAKRFVDEADVGTEPALKCALLVSAASLVWQYKKRGREKDADRLFLQALDAEPGDPRATRLYVHTLGGREKWNDATNLLLESAEKTKRRDDRLSFFLQAARIAARKLDQPDRAAAIYDQVVSLSPGHAEGMAYLVQHFTARESWDHLVALYDDALRGRLKPEAEQGNLLQVGMVHWRFRNDPAAAEPYFARLRKLDPIHPGMLGFYREYLTSTGDTAKLVTILSDAQRATQDAAQKASLGVELARAAQAGGALDKAADAWKAVLRADPKNADATPALREIYRASGKWNALVEVLKAEVDARDASEVEAKVATLREMVSIYRDELKLEVMAVNTWNAILALQPADQEALDALAASYEAMERWNDLIQTLTRMAEATSDTARQVELYMRIARLWIDRFANYNQATRPLELVVEKDPSHRPALNLLKEIYSKRRAWKQLFDVLSAEAALASDPDVRQAHRVELARLAAERLHRPAEAIALYRQVLEADTANAEALDALEKLSEREKDWATLAEVTERRIERAVDDREKARFLAKLAALYGEQLDDGARAREAWRRILELDPKNGRALRTLRESYVQAGDWDALERLYGETNDWDGLAEVLGNAAERASDAAQKAELSFRAAEVYETKIGEPQRAFRAYERVLAADPTNARAARALLPLYERDEKWSRLPALYDVLIDHATDAGERRELAAAAHGVALERLKDAALALRYATEAFVADPRGDAARERLEEAAARAGNLATVVTVYEARLAAIAEGEAARDERTWLRHRIASISAEKLGDIDHAASSLRAILSELPEDPEATAALETLLRDSGRHADLRAHYKGRIDHAADDDERWALTMELARLEEHDLGDAVAAAALYRRALELRAEDTEALEALDRLAVQAGRWEEAIDVLSRRRALAADADRTDLTLRLGELLLDHGSDPGAAQAAFAEVLERSPSDARAIVGLERIRLAHPTRATEVGRLLEPAYEATGAFDKLREIIDARLAVATDPGERRALRLRSAELSLGPIGDAKRAYETLETAFLDAPSDVEVADRLAAAAEAADQHEAHAVALATIVEAGDLETEALRAVARRAGQVYREVLGRPADAEVFERKVLELDPSDDEAFEALKVLYTDAERWQDLQALYRQRLEQTVDVQAKLDLLLHLSFVLEELTNDPRSAIPIYREVLELDPSHEVSRRALDRLYVRTEQWRDLAELLRSEVDAQGDADASETWVRIGQIFEAKLKEPASAVDAYEAAIERTPEHAGATEALERLLAGPTQRHRVATILEPIHELHEDHARLVRVLEVQAEGAEDDERRVALLTRVAEIAASHLGDFAMAFDAYARAVPLAPTDAALREELANATRARVAQAGPAGARAIHGARAEVLKATLARASAADPSGQLERELVDEIATLFDVEADDAAEAEPWLERMFDLHEDDPEARRRAAEALERIHLGSGQPEKLAVDLRRRIDLEDDPSAKRRLLVRLADLEEQTLGDPTAAIRTYRERVELDPSDVDALRSLERLYTERRSWAELADVLEQLDASAESDAERRAYALRTAGLAHQELGDVDRAIRAYSDVVARFGPAHDALEPLILLYEAKALWSDLLDALEQLREIETEGGARARSLFREAEIRRTKLDEPERAVELYDQVLELDPSHEGALAALVASTTAEKQDVRIEAARRLRPRFEARGASRELLSVLDVLAAVDDPIDRLDALRRGAEVADALGDASGAYRRLSDAIRIATSDPDLGYLLSEADRLVVVVEQWLEHRALLEEVAGEISDGELQLEAYRRLAELQRDRLNDAPAARATFERILELRPDDASALAGLLALVEAAEDWPAVLDVLRRKAELADGREERAALLVQQARLSEEKLGDAPSAIALLDEVLVDADPPQVYASLERLYGSTERWDDLAALYERMLEKGVGSPVEIRHRLGAVRAERLGDVEGAIEQYRDALLADPSHAASVSSLERLMSEPEHRAAAATVLEPIYLARLDWKKLEAALEARLEGEPEPEPRKEILARIGQIHEDYLEDLSGAFDVYLRLVREDPRDEGSWDTLTRLARVLERFGDLADVYRGVLADIGVDDAVTYRLAMTAAELYENRAGAPDRAIELLRLASAYAPGDREPFDALERLLVLRGRWDELLELYRQRIDGAESDEERIALLEKSAAIERDQRGDAERAIRIYDELLEVDPRHPTASVALESLLVQTERWNDLADLLRLRIDHADGTEEALALKTRLGDVQAQRQGEIDAAIDTYEDVVSARPDQPAALAALEALVVDPAHQLRIIRILEPIYQLTDQWKKQIAIHEAEVNVTEEPAEKVRLLREIARLHEDRGRSTAMAFEAYGRALAADAADEDVRANVDRIAAILGDWDGLVAAYEAALAATGDPGVQSSLLSTLARVHDEKRGDPRAAIQTYERMLAVDPSDPSPLDGLEALHTMVGDWGGIVSTLEKKVERSYDPVERGEILRRAGSVAEDLLGDVPMAVGLYRRAIDEDDGDAIAYESLDRLYEDVADFAALAPVLSRRLELETDPDVRAEVGLRLGRIAEEHLRDADTAIRAYQQVLADRPGEATALESLGRLYERQALWPEFLENLRFRAAAADSSASRIAFLFRSAEILERELDDVPEALATHQTILSIDPRYESSIAALRRIAQLEDHREAASEIVLPFLEAQGRWQDVAELEELVVAATSDPLEKQHHLVRLARIHEEGRGDQRAAFDATRRALAEDAGDRALVDQLERLGGALGAWEEVADVLSARAGASSDTDTALDLLGRLARITEQALSDDARAIDAHRRRLELVADDEDSLAALDRLYTKGSSWNELVDVLDRRAQNAAMNAPGEHMELLVRLGTLRAEHFGDAAGAFSAFREVLERDPSEPRALGATERLLADEGLAREAIEVLDAAYRATGAVSKIAGLYDVRIRLADSDSERVRLWLDLAHVRENDLADMRGALDAVVKAYELDPRDEGTLEDVERLASGSGRFEVLRGLAERVLESSGKEALDSTMKRDLLLRAASWYRDRLGDREATERALRAALEADAESSRAHEELVELLRAPGREEALVEALLAWARVEFDEPARITRLLEAAELARSARSDLATARRAYEQVLVSDPIHARALDALVEIATNEARYGDAASLLERRVEGESDPATRIEERRRLAKIVERHLGDARRSIDAWQALLDEVPTDLEAISALETIYEATGQHRELEELVQRRLDIAESEADRLSARVRLARLAELQGRRADAMDQLRDLLADAPDNAEALDALEALYKADGQFESLATSVRSRAEASAARGDRAEERRLLQRLATIEEQDLHRPADAAATYEQIRGLAPDDADALGSLVRLYRALERPADAVTVLEQIGASLSGAEAAANALEVAELAERSLDDVALTERALRRALAASPADARIRERLRAFFTKGGNARGLAELLAEDAAAATDPKKKGALYKELAELREKQLGDPAGAAEALEQAVALDPEDRSVLLPLSDLYVAAGRSSDAIPVLEKIIASYGTRRSKEVAAFHHRLGRALEALGRSDEALAAYDAAFKVDLTNVAILRDLGRLCYAKGDLDRAQKTFRALQLQKLGPDVGITKGDVYFYLGDITAKQGDAKKAISMLERALIEEPGHAEATALLAQLKG